MNHRLILPNEFREKLNDVTPVPPEWNNLGATNTDELIQVMIDQLNASYSKLNITSHRFRSKEDIKRNLNNVGNPSVYSGYIEDDDRNILGLFFYVEPLLNSGNDLITRSIWPTLMGIHKGNHLNKSSLFYTSRPVFIVNLNLTGRVNQPAFKKGVICNILLGFRYIDLFNRAYLDVIPNNGTLESVNNLANYHLLISENGNNNYFQINNANDSIILSPTRVTSSSNASAELYRYYPKILPACYMAMDCGFRIDHSQMNDIYFDDLNNFLLKLEN